MELPKPGTIEYQLRYGMFSYDLIRQARLEAGLTQQELAYRVGIHVSHVRRLESTTNPVSPRIETIRKIAEGLGIDPDVITENRMLEKLRQQRDKEVL